MLDLIIVGSALALILPVSTIHSDHAKISRISYKDINKNNEYKICNDFLFSNSFGYERLIVLTSFDSHPIETDILT